MSEAESHYRGSVVEVDVVVPEPKHKDITILKRGEKMDIPTGFAVPLKVDGKWIAVFGAPKGRSFIQGPAYIGRMIGEDEMLALMRTPIGEPVLEAITTREFDMIDNISKIRAVASFEIAMAALLALCVLGFIGFRIVPEIMEGGLVLRHIATIIGTMVILFIAIYPLVEPPLDAIIRAKRAKAKEVRIKSFREMFRIRQGRIRA